MMSTKLKQGHARFRIAGLVLVVLLGWVCLSPAPYIAMNALAEESEPALTQGNEEALAHEPGDDTPAEDLALADKLPTVEELYESVTDRLTQLKDLSALISIRLYDPQRQVVRNELEADVQAVLSPYVVRVAVRKPDLYRGDTYVLDYEKNQVFGYVPVLDMVQCSTIEQFVSSFGVNLNLNGMFGLPELEQMGRMEIVAVEELDGAKHYVLRLVATEAGEKELEAAIQRAYAEAPVSAADTFYVWVDVEKLIVTKMEERNAQGQLVASFQARNVRLDSGLSVNGLKSFPRGVEVRACR